MPVDPKVIEERVARGATGALYALSLTLGQLGFSLAIGQRLAGAVLGVALAGGLAWVWGERTRPKTSIVWWLGGLAVLALGAVGGTTFVFPLVLGLLVGVFLSHDMRLTPSLMIAGGFAGALWQPGKRWSTAPEEDAWWIALAVLAALVAALFERDRLARRQAPPMPVIWTGIRVAFLTVWTVAILAAKEQLQVGRMFAYFGADPTDFEGQLMLLAILLVCLVLAGIIFRSRPTPAPPTVSPPGPQFAR